MKLRDFRNVIIIIIVSIFITIIMPGIISYCSGTFYAENIKTKIPSRQQRELDIYVSEQKNLEEQLSAINNKLNSAIKYNDLKGDEIEAYLKLKDKITNDTKTKAPINLIPFYLNPQMLLWLGIYAAFMILIYLLLSQEKLKFKLEKKCVGFAVLIYMFYEWPLWVRNFLLTSKGRTVYAYPNIDIDKGSFFYQELIIFFFCFFISNFNFHLCRKIFQSYSQIQRDN